MISGIIRMFFGIFLLPACYALAVAFFDLLTCSQVVISEVLYLTGGIAAFLACWFAFPHPVKAYVFGHEMTHALWGMLFGARASRMKVTDKGGSVHLSKTNVLITLAPYFFPFYTFVAGLLALAVRIFADPLPCIPLWVFLVGFTWAFHVVFTIDSLTRRQPDILIYGRLFSWTFIFIVNTILVFGWFVAVSSVGFSRLWEILSAALADAYLGVYGLLVSMCRIFLTGLS